MDIAEDRNSQVTTMREEFEVWVAGFWSVEIEFIRDPDQWSGMEAIILSSAWAAWRASRAALVIDLPDQLKTFTEASDWYDNAIAECREAIEAAGMTVAP